MSLIGSTPILPQWFRQEVERNCMDHSKPHAVVEIVHKGNEIVEKAESAGTVAKVMTASHAFRKYDWLHSAPKLNGSGNLRGMILNARWRGAYNISIKYAAQLEKYHVGALASVITGIADSSKEITEIWESEDSMDIKAAKLSTQATAIAMNVLTGVVTTPTHALLTSLQGYCYIADMAKGKPVGTFGKTLKAIDASIQSAAQQVSDGNNIYLFVNTTINPKVSRMLGM
jgi:hypothetical protein